MNTSGTWKLAGLFGHAGNQAFPSQNREDRHPEFKLSRFEGKCPKNIEDFKNIDIMK
jgi:hypothetical protein